MLSTLTSGLVPLSSPSSLHDRGHAKRCSELTRAQPPSSSWLRPLLGLSCRQLVTFRPGLSRFPSCHCSPFPFSPNPSPVPIASPCPPLSCGPGSIHPTTTTTTTTSSLLAPPFPSASPYHLSDCPLSSFSALRPFASVSVPPCIHVQSVLGIANAHLHHLAKHPTFAIPIFHLSTKGPAVSRRSCIRAHHIFITIWP